MKTWTMDDLECTLTKLERFHKGVLLIERITKGDSDDTRYEHQTVWKFWTATHQYHLVATGCNLPDESYLGCTAKTRSPRPGERYNRGRDLGDGPLSAKTWLDILTDIVALELLPLAEDRPPSQDLAVPEEPTSDASEAVRQM